MRQPNVTIVDYGMCNLLNVVRAFEHCGAKVTLSEDPHDLAKAARLVVPGVGAFSDSMKEVNKLGFGDSLKAFALSERPMFGICVGMQMLFDSSEEFGDHAGLGILSGSVKLLPSLTRDGIKLRIPHIGWNHLVEPECRRDWQGTLLDPMVGDNPAVYFVHSYAAVPANPSDRLADCLYGGERICALVQRGNLIASQFHPERSGKIGLAMIRRFLAI